MKNTIVFERGKNPKEGLGIGIEGMKEKYKILVLESHFERLDAAYPVVESIIQKHALTTQAHYQAHFIIINTKTEFMIVKMRYVPMNTEDNPANSITFSENWAYPIKDLNRCITWLAEGAERLNKREDDYGFNI